MLGHSVPSTFGVLLQASCPTQSDVLRLFASQGLIAPHHFQIFRKLGSIMCQDFRPSALALHQYGEKVESFCSPADSCWNASGVDRLFCNDGLHALAMHAAENGIPPRPTWYS